MKFQYRLPTLLAFVVSLGVVIGMNITARWEFVPPHSYGWPVPFYYGVEAMERRGGDYGPVRILGPGIEFDCLVIDLVTAAIGIGGACYIVKRLTDGSPRKA